MHEEKKEEKQRSKRNVKLPEAEVVAREIEAHSDNSRIIGCGHCPRHARSYRGVLTRPIIKFEENFAQRSSLV